MKQSLEAKRKPRELQKRLRTLSEAFLAYTAILLTEDEQTSQRQFSSLTEATAQEMGNKSREGILPAVIFSEFFGERTQAPKKPFLPP